MRISPTWLRDFVDLRVDDLRLAEDLTLAGVAVESVQQRDGETVFEMEIGTNRPDAMNHYGVARECSAIYDIDLKPIVPQLPKAQTAAAPFPIEIEDAKGCGRYTARVIRNVKIASSPASLLERLRLEDHHGVNNAVDASNYALMEMGHPTHAFDLDKLEGGRIIVRRAHAGETLKTLDGLERKLSPEDLVIADAVRPVALAGIMGGLDSAISGSTQNILIESAWFDPATVRKTARRLGMHTDASHIFERGADWGATPLGCDRVAELILQTAGGRLEGEPIDVVVGRPVRHSLWLRHSEILRILGQEIPTGIVRRILTRLGFGLSRPAKESFLEGLPVGNVAPEEAEVLKEKIKAKVAFQHVDPENDLAVELPTWRLDVEREIDLIEEIARVYGYNRFANTLPSFSGRVIELPDAEKENQVRSDLLAMGYNEAISPSFISPADAQVFSSAVAVPLANPVSEEQSMMRTSLVPGMLGMLAWNLNRGATDVRLFESGHVFAAPAEEQAEEKKMISLGATGHAVEAGVHGPAQPFTFFHLKGDMEALLGKFEIRNLHWDAQTSGYYHPGRSARAVANGHAIAQFGQLHPDVAAARKLKQEVFLAEVYLDQLFQLPLRTPRYQPLSRFPAVDRDFSFVFDDAISFEQIHSSVQALNIAELRSFRPVEIFRGGSVPQGKYSVLLRAEFQSAERTLRDDEVAQWSAHIIKALEGLGGSLRG